MATDVIDLTKFEPIGGYPNYLVSPDGIVVSICKNKPKQLKFRDVNGYKRVVLYSSDSKPKDTLVHRIVAQTFLGICEGLEVNHKSGIKSDNRVENLEIVTKSENVKHAHQTGLIVFTAERKNKIRKGSVKRALFTLTEADSIRFDNENGMTLKELSIKYGSSITTMSRIINNEYKTYREEKK